MEMLSVDLGWLQTCSVHRWIKVLCEWIAAAGGAGGSPCQTARWPINISDILMFENQWAIVEQKLSDQDTLPVPKLEVAFRLCG